MALLRLFHPLQSLRIISLGLREIRCRNISSLRKFSQFTRPPNNPFIHDLPPPPPLPPPPINNTSRSRLRRYFVNFSAVAFWLLLGYRALEYYEESENQMYNAAEDWLGISNKNRRLQTLEEKETEILVKNQVFFSTIVMLLRNNQIITNTFSEHCTLFISVPSEEEVSYISSDNHWEARFYMSGKGQIAEGRAYFVRRGKNWIPTELSVHRLVREQQSPILTLKAPLPNGLLGLPLNSSVRE